MMFHVERVEGVVVLLSLMLIAVMSAMLSLFLDHLLEDHPLGRQYLSLIQRLPVSLAKPIGECVICSGAWQYLFTAMFVFNIPFYLCVIGLGVNYLTIKVLMKLQK
jgi:hypothetical protein